MKKSLILTAACFTAILCSCGTSSSYYAYSGFQDGIYYRASEEDRKEAEADKKEINDLIDRTRQEAASFSDTILLSSIDNSGSITAAATGTATPININIIDNYQDYYALGYGTFCSYWDWRYWDMFGPWGRYGSWYDWYNWYSPWFPGIYDPWYPSWGWSWSFAWNSWGWYGPGYWWGGYWDPWYMWGYYPAPERPVYYGKRDTGVRSGAVTGGRRLAASTTVRGTSGNRNTTSTPSITSVRGRTATASSVRSAGAGSVKTAFSGRTVSSAAAAGSFRTAGRANMTLGERYADRSVGRSVSATASGRQALYRRPSAAAGSEFRSPFQTRSTAAGSSFSTSFRRASGTAAADRTFGTYNNSQRNSAASFNRSSRSNVRSLNNSSVSRSVSTRSSFSSGGRSSFSGGGSRSGGSVRR